MPTWLIFLFLPLIAQLGLLYVLAGALNGMTYRRFGKAIYLLLMWPGVVIHELSHFAGCILTATKVVEVKLFSPHDEGGSFVLGYVSHVKPRGAFTQVAISAAPFFGGAAALWGLLKLMTPATLASGIFGPPVFAASSATGVALAVKTAAIQYWSFVSALYASLDWWSWKTYLFLYLLLSVSAHIAPSKPDMRHAVSGAFAVGVMLFILAWLGARYAPAAAEAFASGATAAVGGMTALLSYGVVCVTLAWLAMTSVSFLLGRIRRR